MQPRPALRRKGRRTTARVLARLRCERGQSMVVFVGFIGVALSLFALVIDGGEHFFKSREAQNAADAGALAGAQQLCPKDTDAHRASCEDKATAKAAEYAQADDNMPDGSPTVTLLTKDGGPVSSSNPYTKVRVQISADAPLFFANLLGVSSTKAVGACRADSPASVGQCAIASADQTVTTTVVTTPATTTTTPGTTTTTYPNDLFAFAKGDGDANLCESMVNLPGSGNVFDGDVWSNENLIAPGSNNGADVLTVATSCTPTQISDDHFTAIHHHAPIDWPVTPPTLTPIAGVPCIAGGKLAVGFTATAAWRAANPPGIYCADTFNFNTSNQTYSGYTWVANKITTSGASNTFIGPSAANSRGLLFYALSSQSNAVAINNGNGQSLKGDVIAPNGGVDFSGSSTSAVDGFLEALSLKLSGSGTHYKGTGPSPEPITTTTPATTTTTPATTNTVTAPGDVSVDLDW